MIRSNRFAEFRNCVYLFALAIGLLATISTPASAGSWAKTGSMNVNRYGPTTTLLTNGEVLVAGGTDPNWNGYSSAEEYNPATGQFTLTGSMHDARFYHTATLLPNGKVLVVGGTDNLNVSPATAWATAELYDSSTGAWSSTGSLHTGRWGHVAVLLSNGKVLVAGGATPSGNYTTSAELYDPSTGQWTITGSMLILRYNFDATALQNGKALVSGGYSGSVPGALPAECELYNPATGTWSATGNLNDPTADFTQTLLSNNEVLAVAGNDGNATNHGYGQSAQLYNPATGTWTTTGSLHVPRIGNTETLLANGEVLVAGGQNYNNHALAEAELFNPSTGVWTTTSSMTTPRTGQTATLLQNGKVLVAGGFDGAIQVATAELYTP